MLARILLVFVSLIPVCRCLPVVDNQPTAGGQAGAGADPQPRPAESPRSSSVLAAPKSEEATHSQPPSPKTSSVVTDTQGQSQTGASSQQGQGETGASSQQGQGHTSTSTQTAASTETQGQPKTSTASKQSQSKPIVSTAGQHVSTNLVQGQLDHQAPIGTQSNKATIGRNVAGNHPSQGQASSTTESQGQGATSTVESQQNKPPTSAGVNQGQNIASETTGGNPPQKQVQISEAKPTVTTGAKANQAKGQIQTPTASQTSASTGSSQATTTMEPLEVEVEAPEAPQLDPTELEPPEPGQQPNSGAPASASSKGGQSVQPGAQVEVNEIEPVEPGTAQAPEAGSQEYP